MLKTNLSKKEQNKEQSEKQERTSVIEPVKFGPDSKFKFMCHKEIKCFTKCCKNINIILTPYDIIRLKKRLELSSEDFLQLYTNPQILEKTDMPVVTLKFINNNSNNLEDLECPFVRPDGCIVYLDRPTACRYYPLGVANLSNKEGSDKDEFYFFVNEPHCLGFEENKLWRIRDWRKDQGVDIHDEINATWTDLLVKKRSFPMNIKLTERAKELFFMASYNIDKFRQFVFESSFLNRFQIDEKILQEIKQDDVALLKFGVDWLAKILFKENKELKNN